MPAFGGMNIEPFKFEPGRGTAVANSASRVLLAAYMSASRHGAQQLLVWRWEHQ